MAHLVLGLWVVTAFGGAYMFSFTNGAARSRVEAEPGQLTSKLPPLVLFVHPLFGLTGLAFWIAYLAAGKQALAWITLGVLIAGAGIGDVLISRTLRGRKDAEPTVEDRIPTIAMVAHGLSATALIVSVLVVCLGWDSQADDDADDGDTRGPLVHVQR
ncbi:hypothetical protein [Nocardioides marmotae]|uniref:hypothetical protein n=1 Tax=Nocardioides marmotae TaxID=2663857 RepID=UPI0012B65AD5|nr:hypothetical protein [Nocardioides marmotae]MBC9732889.1 hypothetical protein [Nocardioides marmotae]MTB84003.1 hypothetical protein [Nocardioides marmotae]